MPQRIYSKHLPDDDLSSILLISFDFEMVKVFLFSGYYKINFISNYLMFNLSPQLIIINIM